MFNREKNTHKGIIDGRVLDCDNSFLVMGFCVIKWVEVISWKFREGLHALIFSDLKFIQNDGTEGFV